MNSNLCLNSERIPAFRPDVNRVSVGTFLTVRPVTHRPEAACPPPCWDNRTISGFHRRVEVGTPCRQRTMGAGTKVLPNPSRDRDNGGVALPAHRQCADPRFPTQPPHGGGKPRRSRRGGCHSRIATGNAVKPIVIQTTIRATILTSSPILTHGRQLQDRHRRTSD